MGFVYVQTSYFRHPKIVAVSDKAKLLHLASIMWTAEHLTDGFVPLDALSMLANEVSSRGRWRTKWVSELVDAHLWDELPTGWHVHNFEQHNRSSTRAVVEANRAATLARQRRHRERGDRDVTT